MVAIGKLCFLVASCLALASTYIRDGRPTLSPSYHGQSMSPTHTSPVIKSFLSSSSLQSSSLKTVANLFGSHSSTYASAVHQSQDERISITATHSTEAVGGHKTSRETSTRYISRESTPSTIHGSLTLATQSLLSSKGVPSSKGSMQSEKTSVVPQSHLKTTSRPKVSKPPISSFQSPKSSMDHTKKPTTRASQPKVASDSSRAKLTATMMKHSAKQTETATSITRIRSTSVKTKLSTHIRTSQPLRTSIATRKPTKQSTSFPSASKGRATSTMPGRFSITKTSTSSPQKIISTTTSSSEQQSTMPISQKPSTIGTSPKEQLSSVTTKSIGKTASGNSPSFTLGRTIGQETTPLTHQTITHSTGSQNSTTSVTTKHPVGLISTGSTALPAPTRAHTSTITATVGQSASIPRSTAAKTTSRPVKTIVTGSKGIVATYVATQDPKYTTNRKTTTTTDDHGHDIIIFPGGWRWIPIGLPPLRLPPPPKLNPDPHNHDDHGGKDNGHSEDHRTSHSKSSTSSGRCTTTEPPECTKTVSFITSGTGFKR